MKSILNHGSRGTSGSKPHRVGPRPMHVVTAAGTRARDPGMPRGKDVRKGSVKITGKTGLPRAKGC